MKVGRGKQEWLRSCYLCFRQWDEQMMDVSPEELANQATRVLMSGLAQALAAFSLA